MCVCVCMCVVSGTSSTESSGNSTRPVLFPWDIFHKLGLSVKPLSAHCNNYFHVLAYRTLTKPRYPYGKPGVQGSTLHGHDPDTLRLVLSDPTWEAALIQVGLPGQVRECCPRLAGPDRCISAHPGPRAGCRQSPEAGHRASVKKDAPEGTPPQRFIPGQLSIASSSPDSGRVSFLPSLFVSRQKHFMWENHIFYCPPLNLYLLNTQLLRAFQTVAVRPAASTKGGRGCCGASCVNAPITDFRNYSRTQLRAITIITHP